MNPETRSRFHQCSGIPAPPGGDPAWGVVVGKHSQWIAEALADCDFPWSIFGCSQRAAVWDLVLTWISEWERDQGGSNQGWRAFWEYLEVEGVGTADWFAAMIALAAYARSRGLSPSSQQAFSYLHCCVEAATLQLTASSSLPAVVRHYLEDFGWDELSGD